MLAIKNYFHEKIDSEAVVQRWSDKKLFLEISQNSDLTWNFIWKETLAQVFSDEFCEISKYTFFIKHLWWLLLQIFHLCKSKSKWKMFQLLKGDLQMFGNCYTEIDLCSERNWRKYLPWILRMSNLKIHRWISHELISVTETRQDMIC